MKRSLRDLHEEISEAKRFSDEKIFLDKDLLVAKKRIHATKRPAGPVWTPDSGGVSVGILKEF